MSIAYPLISGNAGAQTGTPNAFTQPQTFKAGFYSPAEADAPVLMKPGSDTSAGVIQWYSESTAGYLIHFTDGVGMTGDGLIGLGLSNSGVGLVVSMHAGNGASAVGIAINSDATQAGTGLKVTQFSPAPLAIFQQAMTGSPGPVLVVQQYPNATAGHSFSLQDTSANEFGFFDHQTIWHLINASQGHEVYWNHGAGIDEKMYVYTGSAGLFWAFDLVANSNHLKLQASTTAQAKGSETMVTLVDIATAASGQLAFFGAAAINQPNTTGTTLGFTAGTGTAVNSGSTFTGNTGTTAYTIGDLVHALKSLGLLAS